MRVKTIAIIAWNQTAIKPDNNYNTESTENLICYLHTGHYPYYREEMCQGCEGNSVIIFNILLKDLLMLAHKFNQQSVAFVDMTNTLKVSYQYWEKDDDTGALMVKKDKHEVIDAKDSNDYYAKIYNYFEFRTPFSKSLFFDRLGKLNERLEKKEQLFGLDRIERMIKETMDRSYTGYHRYTRRGMLYGK